RGRPPRGAVVGGSAPPSEVGRSRHDGETPRARGFRGRARGGELRDHRPDLRRLLHVRRGGVVVAGEAEPVLLAEGDEGGWMAGAEADVMGEALLDQHVHLRVGQPVATLVVLAILREAHELPLAWGVVHERDQAQQRILYERSEVSHHELGADLAAQMEMVIGAEAARVLSCAHRLDERARVAWPLPAVDEIAHGEAVQDGGDAGRRELGIVGEHGRGYRPQHPRPRRQMLFQHVGVELHEAGHEEIPFEVEAAGARARPRGDVRDDVVHRADAAAETVVSGDHPGVGDDELSPHAASASLRLTTRVATRSRTSVSWKVPRSAVPRWRASWTSCTTRARLGASSDAVGSSRSREGGPAMDPPATLTRFPAPPAHVTGESPHRRSGLRSRPRLARARSLASAAPTPRARSGSATTRTAGTRGMTRRNWLT